MEQKRRKRFWAKAVSLVLSFAISFSGMGLAPGGILEVEGATNVISITSASDLAKIGVDPGYPMDGDYVLTANIDLSGAGSWTPIGGACGPEYALVSGARVFSGTFDGAGHVIDGLTIQYDGSSSGESKNVSGLFAMIGSDSSADYAEVKNINFTNVSITHTLGRGDTIGALTGDVNGYARVDNIAVLSGDIQVKGSSNGDLIGVGGIAGQTRTNSAAVQMTNLYNAASVSVDSAVSTRWERCGGILGRIHQQGVIGALSSSVNVGRVTFKGAVGYAINGYSDSIDSAANKTNIVNCYYITGRGKDFGAATAVSEEELASEAVVKELGADYWAVYNGKLTPIIGEGKVVAPIPSPQFAEGDSASSVTKDFMLPLTFLSEEGEEEIFWSSANTDVISIDNESGTATVSATLADTSVKLTAVTSVSGRTKTIEVTVRSNLILSIDKEYAKPGVPMTAQIEQAPVGASFSYTWEVSDETVSDTASYTPAESDLNNWITVTASLDGAFVAEKRIYCSKLPVVYIDTTDGYGITSKTQYKDAAMHIQGNDTFNSKTTSLYDGGISIRGRGNSTWNTGFNKLPYKIKLDKKTDLLGFGVSKHWALLANYMDESLIRNTTSYDLAGEMGLTPHLKSTHVELILNGVYAGNYQLVGNVRIDKSRVNIYDWEDLAGDVAKAIGQQENLTGNALDVDALEDYLNEHMQWITDGSVTYQNKTYKISDYFTDIPRNADGSVNVSGGFLFELDEYYDEVSKFKTSYNQPIMFKSPEFANTNTALFNSAKNYIQAVENSFHAGDFYTEYAGEKKHYTDLVDLDSLVNYLILNEFYWNTETMKKSTYMYKDLDSKLVIGPVWDMDWTSGSLVSAGETGDYSVWMVLTANKGGQGESWYRYLIGDPYFVQKMYECYTKNRQNFENIVKTGGIIDQDIAYLKESGQANYNAGFLQRRSPFETEAERLRTYLKNRLNWMDRQFASLDTLLNSLGKYSASGQISVTADTTGKESTAYTAVVTNSTAKKVGFYINGILAGTAEVSDGKAVYTAEDRYLDKTKEAVNIVQVRAMDAAGTLLSGGAVTNYAAFTKDAQAEPLTGQVTIIGHARVGSELKAEVSGSNHTGALSYQWKADGTAIAGATAQSYLLTEAEEGKCITVEVTSSIETGSLVSDATKAVVKTELKNDHIIINQVYGGGANNGTPVSHSFIELHNPTDDEISLNGCSLGYISGGKNGAAVQEVRLALTGSIPAHASYLVRCEAQDEGTPELITLRLEAFDQEWSQSIDNKRYQLILYHGEEIVDGVSVNETAVEGPALPDGTISKQKAIRRKDFADTDNNQEDFEVISYQGATPAVVEANRPRSLKDGSWGAGGEEPKPGPAELSGKVSIRGNAICGAILYADDATNSTGTLSYQWKADGTLLTGENGQFYVADESCLGKKISVTVTSSAETGELEAVMEQAITAVAVQKEHLIILQVYGGGGKGGTPVSHSFIELYNPTPRKIDLEGYYITYLSSEKSGKLMLSGSIPASSSYLIQCAPEENGGSAVTLSNPDCNWDLTISNKRYSVRLMQGETQIDGISVNEEAVEGAALLNPAGDEIISKNKAVRRICFVDTDDNAADFEVLNYSKLPPNLLVKAAPRSVSDGVWGLEPEPEKPDPELIQNLKDLIAEVGLKEKDNYTADSYERVEQEAAEAKKILENPNATPQEIKTALENLQKAILQLQEKPEQKPDDGTNPNPGDGTNQNPGDGTNPNPGDGTNPNPGDGTNENPGGGTNQNPGDGTNENPGGGMSQNPGDGTNSGSGKPPLAVGSKFRSDKGWYKVTKSAVKGGTVTYLKPASRNYKKVVIPATVKRQGITYKVKAISARALKGNKRLTTVTVGKNIENIGVSAFEGCRKLQKITIKTKTLKKVGRNALKGVNGKCKIKVPKKLQKKYTVKFKKKGQKPGVKVVK
ncbi:hypothetical protein D3Z36_00505 [Lachnospiraceae bacterium]|nr:hypothetical protein [Lachnospiraceae bacterium]